MTFARHVQILRRRRLTNQTRFLCFNQQQITKELSEGFPRALLAVCHAQKRRALGLRMSVPYNWNGTTHMRSSTNITNLGWNSILLRLQICIHMYMWDSKTYPGYFQPIRSRIKNSRWRRPWKCDPVGKQHWGGPGITGSMAPTSKSIQCLAVLNGRCEVRL